MERQQFNTVTSAAMKMLNALEKIAGVNDSLAQEGLSFLLRMLAPITPHISDTLWQRLGFGESILDEPWPTPDPRALERESVELVLQINGKLRGTLSVPSHLAAAEIEKMALSHPVVEKFLNGSSPRKIILVPQRLVNIVI